MNQNLIWTRAEDRWLEDQALLARLPLKVVSCPCISSRPLEVSIPDKLPDAAIVTSPLSLFYLRDQPALTSQLRQRPIYCFGSKTAQALKASGFRPRLLEAESAKALHKLLPSEQSYLFLGPTKPAFDMVSALKNRGISCDSLKLYETIELSPQLPPMTSGPKHWSVALASPSAVRGFLSSYKGPPLTAHVIGQTTAKACGQDFEKVLVSPNPGIGSLISAISSWANAQG